jgi:protein-tyrosine phosphatase
MRARTSHTHPLLIAEVRASHEQGRIGITFCPGKRDLGASTGAWARDLELDLDVVVAWGAKLVLTLVEPHELKLLAVPHLGRAIEARGLHWRHLPIVDVSVPCEAFEAQWATTGKEIRGLLRGGSDVVVHCRGGLGRAGMIAARLLAELGMRPNDAVRLVRSARPGAIETPAQHAAVLRTQPIDDGAEQP